MNSELCNFLTCQYSSSSFNSTEHLKINTVVAMKLAAQEPLGKWYAEVVQSTIKSHITTEMSPKIMAAVNWQPRSVWIASFVQAGITNGDNFDVKQQPPISLTTTTQGIGFFLLSKVCFKPNNKPYKRDFSRKQPYRSNIDITCGFTQQAMHSLEIWYRKVSKQRVTTIKLFSVMRTAFQACYILLLKIFRFQLQFKRYVKIVCPIHR